MKRRAFVGGSIAAAGLLAGPSACRRSKPHEPAPIHVTAEQLLARVKESGARGHVTALHFWATWCGPCIEEFPLLEREWRGWIKQEPRLDFLAVSVDEPTPPALERLGADGAAKERDEAVKAFVREHGASFPVGIAVADDPDTFSATIDEGWPSVLPTTLLFGRDGTVVWRNIGVLRVSAFRDQVRDALAA